MSIAIRKKLEAAGLKEFYKNKKRAGLYDMKTKDFLEWSMPDSDIYCIFGIIGSIAFYF